jgi:type III pantothenate kinase
MADQLLLVSVGNTRTRFAVVRDGQLEPSRVEPNADPEALFRAVASHRSDTESVDGEPPATPVMLASVNRPVSDALQRSLQQAGRHVSRLGTDAADLPIPIEHTLEEPSGVGADRLLDALGAFSRARAACVVIDAGTAITVDFIDGQGVFHGGAIAPGLRMMLEALHEKTAALPLVALSPESLPPADEKAPPFGRSTRPAIALGVISAARGLAHLLIDRYAQFYEAYPRVIATGGDAALLFENDPLVEHILPDLPLMGMLEAYRRLEQLDDEADRGAAEAP